LACSPLRISLERAWLYGACCAIVVSIPFIVLPWFHDAAYRADFATFWSAGANAGTATLTKPAQLQAWAQHHHVIAQPFSYPPAFAWFYAPLSLLTPMTGLIVEELGMTALFIAAALLAARVYGFNPWFGVAAVLGWAPTVNSIEVGQNVGLAVALIFVVCWALHRRSSTITGVAAGLLLYKPTVALPIILLLVARKEWRALGVVMLCALGWYLASAAPTGEWLWPATYLHTMAWWVPMDFLGGTSKAYTVPTLLMSRGVSLGAAWATGAVILLAALPWAARAPAIEAASMMPLVGLTASIHAWPYEAALALPAIFYAMATLREPWRTRIVGTVYVVVAVALITRFGSLALAALCIGATALWLVRGYAFELATVTRRARARPGF
jgi:hypothetical protein